MISIRYVNQVAVLSLNRNTTNAINLGLLQQLEDGLQGIEEDSSIHGVVLTSSSPKFLSIGFDIPQLLTLERDQFSFFYRTFNLVCLKLYTLPKPVVAAITGHAVAGGCILSTFCDRRFIGRGRCLMGINGIKYGITIPYLAHRVLTEVIGERNARWILESGEFFLPNGAKALKLVDKIIIPGEVIKASIMEVQRLAGDIPQIFNRRKQRRVQPTRDNFFREQQHDEQKFIDNWFSPGVQELLQQASNRF